jgi:energy-converting hydrogenase B subunit D
MVLDILLLAAGAIMVAAGIGAVLAKSLLVSIILSGGVSLLASLVFLLIGAPDVAMTEAAIGSGLTTVVFLYALSRARQADDEASDAPEIGSIPVDLDTADLGVAGLSTSSIGASQKQGGRK